MKHLLPAVQRTALRIPWAAVGGCAAALLLTAAAPGGQYAPWALAAVAAAGVGWPGLLAVVCAGLGALLFMDFQPGLRHTAAALLIFCANTALCNTRLYRRPRFRPMAAVCAAGLTQLPYLIQRGGRQWALCMAALALLYGAAALLPDLLPESAAEQADKRRAWFLLLLGVCAVPAGWTVMGFSPAAVLTAVLLLYFVGRGPVPDAAAAGALAGLTLDLCGTGELYLAVVLCAAASAAAGLRRGQRVPAAAAFCAAGVLAALLLGEVRPLAVLCQLLTAAGVWLLLPEKEGPLLTAAGEVSPEAAAPAAAFRAVYDSLEDHAPLLRPENPAVLFDRAAEQVCRNCLLTARCWQTEYSQTYNAFNDACGPMLKRGRAEAEDFPLFFSSRCLHFPDLLGAINTEVYAFRLRRQYRTRLEDMRELAEAQYEHLGEVLGSETAPEPEGALLRCRVGTLLRPKEGESACGDQLAVFTAGAMLYMLLSDGMGSGAEAHAESAMTVRLLRQFLKAGIRPASALKTLNTALTLRCQEGGGFTTIDLLALDRRTGAATLYKYGAAASYVKRGGTVTRLEGGSLPAGLQDTRQPPEATGIHLEPGSVLVMVSDGVTSEGDDWLRELLASWPGGDSQELAQLILADSRRHGGLKDDCAALALRLEKSEKPAAKRV